MLDMTSIPRTVVLIASLLLMCASPALAVLGLFENKTVNEQERIETMEKIQDVQEKLKLLQDKLKALERRKAVKESGDEHVGPIETAPAANWQKIDENTIFPGDFGVYTYLLFIGTTEDTAAIGMLEDLILTIETLPGDTPPGPLGNRFLVPVQVPQSSVEIGRQPYDFGLNEAFLNRFDIERADKGPVLISSASAVDPYAPADTPAFLVATFGQLPPGQVQMLLDRWHQFERPLAATDGHPLAGLFADLLDGIGPTRVERNGDRLSIDFSR